MIAPMNRLDRQLRTVTPVTFRPGERAAQEAPRAPCPIGRRALFLGTAGY